MTGLEEMQGEIKCEIKAVELKDGEWLATSTQWPEIVGTGPTLEDSIVELFDLAEQAKQRGPRSH